MMELRLTTYDITTYDITTYDITTYDWVQGCNFFFWVHGLTLANRCDVKVRPSTQTLYPPYVPIITYDLRHYDWVQGCNFFRNYFDITKWSK